MVTCWLCCRVYFLRCLIDNKLLNRSVMTELTHPSPWDYQPRLTERWLGWLTWKNTAKLEDTSSHWLNVEVVWRTTVLTLYVAFFYKLTWLNSWFWHIIVNLVVSWMTLILYELMVLLLKRGSCFQCTYILKALGDHFKVVKKISSKLQRISLPSFNSLKYILG